MSWAPVTSVHHLTYENIGHEAVEELQGVCNPCHRFLSAKSGFDPSSIRQALVKMQDSQFVTDDEYLAIYAAIRRAVTELDPDHVAYLLAMGVGALQNQIRATNR